jgi:hypothetical protein
MGAILITKELPGSLSERQIEERFRKMSEHAAYAHGHEYSGSWNMFSGIDIAWSVPAFDGVQEATDFIEQNSEKYEDAIAVRFKSETSGGPAEVKWLLGGWAAS